MSILTDHKTARLIFAARTQKPVAFGIKGRYRAPFKPSNK